jgi:hypothetical protein
MKQHWQSQFLSKPDILAPEEELLVPDPMIFVIFLEQVWFVFFINCSCWRNSASSFWFGLGHDELSKEATPRILAEWEVGGQALEGPSLV